MAAKVGGKAAVADGHNIVEFNVNTGNSSTGQEWIIDAYSSLEPSVSKLINILFCNSFVLCIY